MHIYIYFFFSPCPIPQIIWFCRHTWCLFVFSSVFNVLPLADSSVLMQDESRSLGGEVAIDMDSRANPLQLQLIDEQVSVSLRKYLWN